MGRCSPRLPLLLLLLSLLAEVVSASEFKICAYNVENFNSAKASDSRVLHTVKQIVSRCDVCLLQNVVDSGAVTALLDSLNRETDRYDGHSYQNVSSTSLGNSPDDMQHYVFIYRNESVNVTGQYQYLQKNTFVRPPFVVQFQSNKIAINSFILVPLRSDPSQAVQEIDRLYDVFKVVSKKWNNTNVMFLGDFHAGCAYVTRADKRNIRMFSNFTFHWLIRDKVDTTISTNTNCAYDRIVVHGKTFLKAVRPYSAKVFNYVKEFKLPTSKALKVSQNLPVEVTLKSSALLLQATPILILIIVSSIVQSFLSAR